MSPEFFWDIYLFISITLSTIISGASYNYYYSGVKQPDSEKVSVYECGFDPSRVPFSVNFFLVGILFWIFDLEISFLFPCGPPDQVHCSYRNRGGTNGVSGCFIYPILAPNVYTGLSISSPNF